MKPFDLIEELPGFISERFDVLESSYKENEAFEAAHAFGEHLAQSYDVRFVLINGETGQLDSTTLYEDEDEAQKAAADRCMVAMLLAESLEPTPMPKTIPISDVLREAQDAFWDAVVKRFPEAKHGDLSPGATVVLHDAEEEAIKEWIHNNVPPKAA
jgi:hypothetical protein